jgi:transposase
MTGHVCGIDIGKTVFHLIGLSKEGQIVIKKRFTRKQLITHMANMPACLIGMEACPGAHFLARVLRAQGHEVKLMPAEYVRPFVKSNKNDYVDAEAIAEAVQRPTMRFVPIKSEAQLEAVMKL